MLLGGQSYAAQPGGGQAASLGLVLQTVGQSQRWGFHMWVKDRQGSRSVRWLGPRLALGTDLSIVIQLGSHSASAAAFCLAINSSAPAPSGVDQWHH